MRAMGEQARQRRPPRSAGLVEVGALQSFADPTREGRGRGDLLEDRGGVEERERRAQAGRHGVTRPRPLLRHMADAGADGIQGDVPGDLEEVPVALDQARAEAALDEMADASAAMVE